MDKQNDGLEKVTPFKKAIFGIYVKFLGCTKKLMWLLRIVLETPPENTRNYRMACILCHKVLGVNTKIDHIHRKDMKKTPEWEYTPENQHGT